MADRGRVEIPSHLKINTPRGSITSVNTKGGKIVVRLKWNSGFAPEKEACFNRAQAFVDSECLRRMNPLAPRRTGMLIKSGTLGTVIGSGEIEYLAPYARKQYYKHKTKAKWFERMKASHKEPILKGAMIIAAGKK